MTQTTPPEKALPSPLSCLTGSLVAGIMSIGMYTVTVKIATTFATNPMVQKTTMAINIAAALKTLVVGAAAMGTGISGIISLGLIGLAIQVAFDKNKESLKN